MAYRVLEEARAKANDNKSKAYRGETIVKVRGSNTGAVLGIPTFRQAAQQAIAFRKGSWKHGAKQAAQWEACFEQYVYPSLGEKRVNDVTPQDVLTLISELWTTKHETALKVKRRVGVVMKWAKAQGYRTDNPVSDLEVMLPSANGLKGHFKALHHENVGAAIQTVKQSGAYRSTILCLEYTILTASRPTEARMMTWDEVNVGKQVWTVPASRMKMKKEHRVPLSSRCMEIVQEVQAYRKGKAVFPGAYGEFMSDSTVSKLLRENQIPGTLHGIARASFRSWCAEQNVAREVAESCLAHSPGGVEASYQRSDLFEQRRGLMQRWGDYLTFSDT